MRRYLILISILSLSIGLLLLRYVPEVTFVEGIVGQPTNLNPAIGPKSEIDAAIEALLFRSLFKYDVSGRLVNDLAEGYEVRDKNRVYEIKIKEKVFWHDERPIVAEDVKFTFGQDPAFTEVTIEVVEEKVIRFKLKKPLGAFLSLLTKSIAPSHLTGVSPPFAVVGNGNFEVQRVRKNGTVTEITLQNLGDGKIRNLTFKFFQTQEALEEAAKRGEVDALVSDSFNHPSFTKYTAPLYERYFAIFFNLESNNKLVRSAAFRKAAARKTPVSVLIDEILGGEGTPVWGPLSGTWAEAKLSFPKFSATLKGGFKGKVTLTVPEIGRLPEVAATITQIWRELGVEIVVALISPAVIEETISSKNFEAIILGQEVSRDPDRYGLWHSTQRDYPGLNITSYADPRADRALEEGRGAIEGAERKRHYLNFQQVFLEDNPAIFLYHPNFSYFVSRGFSGIDLSSIFASSDRFWNVQDWKSF